MTKFIAAVIIILVLYGGWELFFYWERVKNEEEDQKKKAVAEAVVPEQLPGMPYQMESGLKAAQGQGAAGLAAWLKTYGKTIQDPRKAWIELDYVVAVSVNNTAEARRVFAEVKARTPPTSPVYKRVTELEKTYE